VKVGLGGWLRGTAGALVAAPFALLLLGLAQVRDARPRLDGVLASARSLEVAEQLNPLDTSHLEKIHGMTSIALIALGRYDKALARALVPPFGIDPTIRRLDAISGACLPSATTGRLRRFRSPRPTAHERRPTCRCSPGWCLS
jgi:hypothetical protein